MLSNNYSTVSLFYTVSNDDDDDDDDDAYNDDEEDEDREILGLTGRRITTDLM
jgi:hypothetical protein